MNSQLIENICTAIIIAIYFGAVYIIGNLIINGKIEENDNDNTD